MKKSLVACSGLTRKSMPKAPCFYFFSLSYEHNYFTRIYNQYLLESCSCLSDQKMVWRRVGWIDPIKLGEAFMYIWTLCRCFYECKSSLTARILGELCSAYCIFLSNLIILRQWGYQFLVISVIRFKYV